MYLIYSYLFILGYNLFTPAFLSQTTGKTEVAGFLFLSTEHQDKIHVGLPSSVDPFPMTTILLVSLFSLLIKVS